MSVFGVELTKPQRYSWEGSLDELTAAAGEILVLQGAWRGHTLRAPSRPVVVDYRTNGLISPSLKKRYQWRHLVQLVAGCALVQTGQTRQSVAKMFQGLVPSEILELLGDSQGDSSIAANEARSLSPVPLRALEMANEAIPLLAAGLVDHYKRACQGQILVHNFTLSPWLRGAMSRLAGLQVLYGLKVRIDGAHVLVANCKEPLREREWGIPIFNSPDFRYYGIRLLDPATRLPTIDCIDLARQTSSELDFQEQQAFAQLQSTCDQFASRGEEVYTALREFITRHAITTAAEQRRFLEARNMQLAAPFLASCYEQCQPHHLLKSKLLVCATCGAPLTVSIDNEHAACQIRQCKAYDSPVKRTSARQAPSKDSLVAKPHLLVYWCGPGQDETSLFDTALSVTPDGSVMLYPHKDKCDISVDNDTVGIDVKSHANPFLLAETLNRGLGGLELYKKRFIAINDQALSRFPEYLEILRRECNRDDVEFTSVTALRRKLKATT